MKWKKADKVLGLGGAGWREGCDEVCLRRLRSARHVDRAERTRELALTRTRADANSRSREVALTRNPHAGARSCAHSQPLGRDVEDWRRMTRCPYLTKDRCELISPRPSRMKCRHS
eukprot:6139099-Pleurochrysis_carterae.AAC.2